MSLLAIKHLAIFMALLVASGTASSETIPDSHVRSLHIFNFEYTTQWGESIYVQGNHPLLGQDDVTRALRLNPVAFPQWSIKVDFSNWPAQKNRTIQYRYIKRQDHADAISDQNNVVVLSDWLTLPLSAVSQPQQHLQRQLPPLYRLQIFDNVASQYLSKTRPIYLYAPEQLAAKQPLCLLYMHDGQQLFKSGAMGWDLESIIPHLSVQRRCQLIVVGIGNSSDRMREYLPPYSTGPEGRGLGDRYLQFILRELMPWVEGTLLAGHGIEHRIMAGASMGGLISLYIASNSQQKFAPSPFQAIMALSPSLQFHEILQHLNDLSGKIYLDSGSQGPGADHFVEVNHCRDQLLNRGLIIGRNLLHVVGIEHTHQERYWRQRLQQSFGWVLAEMENQSE